MWSIYNTGLISESTSISLDTKLKISSDIKEENTNDHTNSK